MSNENDMLVRFGAVILRSSAICIISFLPITIIYSIVPGGEDGYGEYISNWIMMSGAVLVIIEILISIILWKYAKNISNWMCKDL